MRFCCAGWVRRRLGSGRADTLKKVRFQEALAIVDQWVCGANRQPCERLTATFHEHYNQKLLNREMHF